MAETITNLKVRFGADTSNFKKGLSDGERAMNDFKGKAGNSFDEFSKVFGVNLQTLRDGIQSTQQSLNGFSSAFSSASAGSSGLSKALGILKTALISTGIGALVVALGSLVAYFTKTERGAEFVGKVMKSIGAIVDVLVDRVSTFGEIIFNAFNNPRKAISDLWEALKNNIVNRFTGLIDLFKAVGSGLEALFNKDIKGLEVAAIKTGFAVTQITTGLDIDQQKKLAAGIRGVVKEMKDEAKAAWELQAARDRLEDQEIALIEIQARRRKEIAEARLLVEDENISAEERLKAMQRAADLEKKTLSENLALQREKIRIAEAEIALAESTDDDYRALSEEKAKLHDIETESLKTQRRLQVEINSVTKEIEKQTAAIKKKRDEEFKGAALRIEPYKQSVDYKGLEIDKLRDWNEKQTKILDDAKGVALDFSQAFTGFFEDISVGLGESLGKIISGTGNFKDLGVAVGEAFGGLLISLGKVAISAGIVSLGLSKMFASSFLNPAAAIAAIAAGIGAVALGTALKASLNNIASGGSGSSGTFSGQTSVYDLRDTASMTANVINIKPQTLAVEITGTGKIKGNDIYFTYEKARQNRRTNT